MQDKKTGSFSVLRFLGILFTALSGLMLVFTVFCWVQELSGSGRDSKSYYCVLEPFGSGALGDTYQGVQAEEGYSFYRLDFRVTNQGNDVKYGDTYYGISFNETGGAYDDVLDWWDTGTDEEDGGQQDYLFAAYDYCYLPAGRSMWYSKVVQVRNGVKSFTVDYYPTGDSESRQQSFEMLLSE